MFLNRQELMTMLLMRQELLMLLNRQEDLICQNLLAFLNRRFRGRWALQRECWQRRLPSTLKRWTDSFRLYHC